MTRIKFQNSHIERITLEWEKNVKKFPFRFSSSPAQKLPRCCNVEGKRWRVTCFVWEYSNEGCFHTISPLSTGMLDVHLCEDSTTLEICETCAIVVLKNQQYCELWTWNSMLDNKWFVGVEIWIWKSFKWSTYPREAEKWQLPHLSRVFRRIRFAWVTHGKLEFSLSIFKILSSTWVGLSHSNWVNKIYFSTFFSQFSSTLFHLITTAQALNANWVNKTFAGRF